MRPQFGPVALSLFFLVCVGFEERPSFGVLSGFFYRADIGDMGRYKGHIRLCFRSILGNCCRPRDLYGHLVQADAFLKGMCTQSFQKALLKEYTLTYDKDPCMI